MYTPCFRAAAIVLISAVASPLSLAAQQRPQTIRGHVSGAGNAITAAEIVVTRAPDRDTYTVRTDSSGAFAIRILGGNGDYLVHVNAPGWHPARKRVTRSGNEPVLTVDFSLVERPPLVLATVTAKAERAKPRRGAEFGTELAASERLTDGVAGAVLPDEAGNLDAEAAWIPGVIRTPNGLSVHGVGPDQTTRTLNGMAFPGTDLPRDARTRTRVSTSTYDPSRGGFGGAEVAVELVPGTTYTLRRAQGGLDAPALQPSSMASVAPGGSFSRIDLSAGGDGELVRNRYYYNAAVQASRRTNEGLSLSNANADVLHAVGVAPDSARHLLDLLAARQIPTLRSTAAFRAAENFSYVGRLDRTPQGQHTWNVTTYARLNRSATLSAPTATLAAAPERSSAAAGLQGAYSFYFGRNYLNESRTAFSRSSTSWRPGSSLPGGFVQVLSDPSEGGLASLDFGAGGRAEDRADWIWETTNTAQFFSRNNQHKIKLYVQSRFDRFERHRGSDPGTFGFASLSALAADEPSSFSRELGSPEISGNAWSGVLAAGDQWRASSNLNLVYGVRLEANRYLTAPPLHEGLLNVLGVRTDHRPNTVHASPRLGFSWAYRGARADAFRYTSSTLGTRLQAPRGVIRGGIGEFRNYLSPDLWAEGALEGAGGRLRCLGASVPVPNWAAYLDDAATVPEACVGGAPTATLADDAPSLRVIDESFDAARSWRANLAWSSAVRRIGLTVEGTYSFNLDQPGTRDVNFADRPVFTLNAEGGRPVFVDPSGIVPTTGGVSTVSARRAMEFGRVTSYTSDLRSRSAQLTMRVTPDLAISNYMLDFAYTLSHTRALQRGFDGSTFGSPAEREWAPGDYDTRHRFQLQGGWARRYVSMTIHGTLASGLPFTPLVQGDINGDGFANDRAFVFDPSGAPDASISPALRALDKAAPSWARACLRDHHATAAKRNSCRGPWNQTLNAQIRLSGEPVGAQRANLAITLINPLGGLDRWVNGSRNLRGWGSRALPDPVLYRVSGFDPQALAFQYEVNPRFGALRAAGLAPFRVSLGLSLDLSPALDKQQLHRALRDGLAGRPTAAELRTRYARSVPDLYEMILQESDSLLLSPEQTAALTAAQSRYHAAIAPVWADLAEYLAALQRGFDVSKALKRQEAASAQVWSVTREQGQSIRQILTPLQQGMLPRTVAEVINTRESVRVINISG